MLVWSGIILLVSLQLSLFLQTPKPTANYQTRGESAKIVWEDVLAEISAPTPIFTPTPTPIVSPKEEAKVETLTPSSQNAQTGNNSNQTVSAPTATPTPSEQNTDNWQSFMMGEINNFRASKGLSAVSMNSETCSFARARASEIDSSLSHDGFRNRLNSSSLPYPSFSSVAENLAWHYDYTKVVPGWIDSPGHNENMLKDNPFACVERNGNLFVYEAWKP